MNTVCELLNEGIGGVIGPQTATTASHVQSVCEVFNVPRIETKWDFRGSHGNFLINLYPHPATLSMVITNSLNLTTWKGATLPNFITNPTFSFLQSTLFRFELIIFDSLSLLTLKIELRPSETKITSPPLDLITDPTSNKDFRSYRIAPSSSPPLSLPPCCKFFGDKFYFVRPRCHSSKAFSLGLSSGILLKVHFLLLFKNIWNCRWAGSLSHLDNKTGWHDFFLFVSKSFEISNTVVE